ncbi:MAG: hypothetical protein DHS20C14_19700 [Phycisphaeraceae bacterium]|nr:MAG: hypothetical protein DHS20C14_19700 [Phycisphaeraceae bacterium]
MRRLTGIAGALVVGASCAMAHAQPHGTDFVVRVHDSALELGAVGDGGVVVYPSVVRSAEFGAEGFANFTNDPGVDSQPGQLVPGMAIGFDVLAALREWDGEDFDAISDDTVSVRDSSVILATTPAEDEVVPGDVFGTADNDAGAVFHNHVQFFLNYPSTTVVDGVWLFQWRLWTETPGIAPSETAYVVFAQGAGLADLDDAVDWVEANLVAPVCFADCDGTGVLNVDDIDCYVAGFLGGDLGVADCDANGVLNVDDIDCFVTSFLGGCP